MDLPRHKAVSELLSARLLNDRQLINAVVCLELSPVRRPYRVSDDINPQQAAFLRLYLGRNDKYHGNATRSYMRAFGIDSERSAQVSSSRLLKKPAIAAFVAQARDKALSEAEADAAFVLGQSLRLYDRAMGDAAIEVDVVDQIMHKDEETGERTLVHRVRTLEKREYNPTIAHKALELIGRHTSVQAFQDNVEHTHTHTLIERLNARSRAVEAAAAQRQQTIEGHATVIDDPGVGAQAEKEGASLPPPPDHPAASPGKTPQPGAGAKGE